MTAGRAKPALRVPASTQAERRANSEQKLLAAAAEILVEEGFAAATFDRICERAGFSRGMVTERFGSKDGFTAAAIKAMADQMQSHYDQEIAPNTSPMGAIRAKFETFFWALKQGKIQAYFVLLSAAVANRLPQISLFREVHRREKPDYVRLIHGAQRTGEVNSALDPDSLASLLGCLEIGIAVQAQIDPQLDLHAMEYSVNALLRILGSPREASFGEQL